MTFNTGLTSDFENIRELILLEKPDIIQFQEITPQMQIKLKSLKSFFPYDVGLKEPNNVFSSIILSKHPLKNNKVIDNYTIFANIFLNGTELTIIGVHFLPPVNQFLLNYYSYLHVKFSNISKPETIPKADFNFAIKSFLFFFIFY